MRVCLAILALLVLKANADLYMHNPPGSNDRNRERSDNRNNGDRLFDSQNNGQGGYAWRGDGSIKGAPDPLTYYVGSFLRVEWTNQHACGPNFNSECQIILQYGVSDPVLTTIPSKDEWLSNIVGARDGYPTSDTITADADGTGDTANNYQARRQFAVNGAGNTEGTGTIPQPTGAATDDAFYFLGANGGLEYGMHESGRFYSMCATTERNKGLYHSDQQINGNSARNTRQNPNGNRRGLECAEERDYYPWWNPSPWRDAAVLVSNTDKYCNYFQQQSENVKQRYYCECSQTCRNKNGGVAPITEQECKTNTGSWVAAPFRNLAAPECLLHPFTRDNHLGNAMQTSADGNKAVQELPTPDTASYNWKIPADAAGKIVVLRMRYNISTNDYPATHALDQSNGIGVGYDSSKDCPRITQNNGGVDDYQPDVAQNPQCMGLLTETAVPLYNRPYVNVFGANAPKLSLAINTHQTGRTFQDRSHVFKVDNPPDGVGGNIINLNVRGRRGNIVQCYPAVEYDFVPNPLYITDKDWVHVQFHGSNFNAQKNANNGEGWEFSDRHNMVQYSSKGGNYPMALSSMKMFGDPSDPDTAALIKRWALLDQEKIITCKDFKEGDTGEQNAKANCGKLNSAPARFPPIAADGLLRFPGNSDPYFYASTRDNNFSNRSLKGTMYVTSSPNNTAVIVGAVLGSVAGLALLGGGVLFYGKKHPNTRAGSAYKRVSGMFTKKSAAAPQMEYQRS